MSSRIASVALIPPKAKELDRATRIGRGRASLGMASTGHLGSASRKLIVGGAIWEWMDQGLWNRRDPKHPILAYGGGFGENRKVGRQIFSGVPFESLGTTLEAMLKSYLKHRGEGENFHVFCNRHTVGQLQELFSNE